MLIKIAESCHTQLQGETRGRQHYAQVCELLSTAKPGEMVAVDFDGVDVITGSWLNAMLVPFYRWTSNEQIELFPFLCHVTDDWLDELKLVTKWNQQCYLLTNSSQSPRRAKLVGSLDVAQLDTLKAVLKLGEATGAELERRMKDDQIGPTAWNNRLKDLCHKRLLRRTRQGREQVYSPVIKEIVIDG